MELKRIKDGIHYIPNSTNIGVIDVGEKTVILIDTGIDDSIGKRILKLLEDRGLSVVAIINTHSHADHCGGNQYITDKTGARVYAPELESAIIQFPALEPLYLFSGASPINPLKNKFLMAGPSKVDYTLKKDETVVSIGYTQLGIVPLPGHSPNQIGIVVNNILFCADSVFSKETLEKHRIPFFTDIDKTRETLAFLRDSSYDFYIPSHAEPRKSLVQLVDANLEVIDNIETRVLDEIATRKTTGQVLKCVSSACGIEVRDEPQYYLLNTMMLGYLGSLYGRGKAKIAIEGNMLFWERAQN